MGRLTALGALASAVVLVLGLPILIITGIVSIFSPLLGGLMWVGGLTLILWVLFYAGFACTACCCSRRGLLRALWDSARLVQINLPYAAGLFVLVVVINLGLVARVEHPARRHWLLLLGLGGHALISTALVAATFVFYQDRYRWWVEMRQALLAPAPRPTGAGLTPQSLRASFLRGCLDERRLEQWSKHRMAN